MPDKKAEAVATCTARGREDAQAAARHADLIVFVEINCFRPGDPQHCASQGAQLPVATAHTGKLASATLRGLAATGQERCFSAPGQASARKSRLDLYTACRARLI
jgi:hypothetical protein